VACTVEFTEQFEQFWNGLSEEERISVDGLIRVVESHGPTLQHPFSRKAPSERYDALRELRVPHQQREICILCIADADRNAVVLLTGTAEEPGREVCPPDQIAMAEQIYARYLAIRGWH
jgi:hypothetical protein